eukprot:CAMPEP_0195290924 /NCGR_PEP_ID=MMETSP0707-20130614/6591_1 /TAXON_ID=33640 /ORGANISM="Asterionellopsis glacialis, Strain CCMP134" /LENGTH=334 /DNA_ID=CAMNT_0040351107 /DNA_START=68 /DNA_END=1075 /DNA_ORIENTATION=+
MRNHRLVEVLGILVSCGCLCGWCPTVVVAWTTSSSSSTTPSTLSRSSSSSLLKASRSICVFDKDDFAMKTGEWPYTLADMGRVDTSNDAYFYNEPRFVTHIDDRAIESLTAYYQDEFTTLVTAAAATNKDLDILDLCSSWISHLPITTTKDNKDNNNDSHLPFSYGRVVGVGMNEQELQSNSQLTEYHVQDLNQHPCLDQFDNDSFDVVLNVVSVDYLTQPQSIFQEMYRVLRPGGIALVSFSNRCFPTKAIAMWLQADDIERLTIVGSYFHYAAQWTSMEALDIQLPPMETPARPSFGEMFQNPTTGFAWMNTAAAVAKSNAGDPLFVVKGIK